MTILWSLIYILVVVQVSNLCTTIFLHRSLAHRSLRLRPATAFLMELWIWLHSGIVSREWVAVHRKHHAFSDREGDPHSPKLEGWVKVLFANAWLYRREARNPDTVERYTRDLPRTRRERYWMRHGSVGLLSGMTLAVLLLGPVPGILSFVVQGVVYIFLNSMVNSVCHSKGYRNYDNGATNLRWVAWITAGEGLHNNHHQFPASAKLSEKRWEFDPAWPVIRLLRFLRLAETR